MATSTYTGKGALRPTAVSAFALNLLAMAMMISAVASRLSGQSTNASISGVVLDSSGAVVPRAVVTLSPKARVALTPPRRC
jgi:hypothetical protein